VHKHLAYSVCSSDAADALDMILFDSFWDAVALAEKRRGSQIRVFSKTEENTVCTFRFLFIVERPFDLENVQYEMALREIENQDNDD